MSFKDTEVIVASESAQIETHPTLALGQAQKFF